MSAVKRWLVSRGYHFTVDELEAVASVLFDRWCRYFTDIPLEQFLEGFEFATMTGN